MDYLWDTNILVHYIRQSKKYDQWKRKYRFFTDSNRVFLSIVNVGEIYSLAYQLHWQNTKLQRLQDILQRINAIPIARRNIVFNYATIDAFSQNKLLHRPLPKGMTARNMGKNDLWIASTAHILNLHLITTDKDFDHLDNIYIKLVRV